MVNNTFIDSYNNILDEKIRNVLNLSVSSHIIYLMYI